MPIPLPDTWAEAKPVLDLRQELMVQALDDYGQTADRLGTRTEAPQKTVSYGLGRLDEAMRALTEAMNRDLEAVQDEVKSLNQPLNKLRRIVM